MKRTIHNRIRVFVDGMTFTDKLGSDVVLEEITKLLEQYQIGRAS